MISKKLPSVPAGYTVPSAVTKKHIGKPNTLKHLDQLSLSARVKEIVEDGNVKGETKKSRSEWEFEFICFAIRAGIKNETILGILLDDRYAVGERVREKGTGAEEYGRKEIVRAHRVIENSANSDFDDELDENSNGDNESTRWKPSAKNPLKSAKEFLKRNRPTLIHQNGDWLVHDGSRYVQIEEATINSELYEFLSPGFKPNRAAVANVADGLKAVAHRPIGSFAPPCWLDGQAPFRADETLAFKNGLLHLPSGRFIAGTANFFTRNAIDYAFNPEAPKPRQWRRFLRSVFRGSRKSIATLQEIFGYMLLPDTSLQKAFMWDGPLRGGKGTTARILERVIGRDNCVSPTISDIGKAPILASMVGKQLALISDMRVDSHTNLGGIAANLLRISGEDSVTFDRKYKDAWTGKLLVRFFILTNLPLNIPDVSGALSNRFIVLKSFVSFIGKEDPNLEETLAEELPGIPLWAIAGWKRLKLRGRFRQTPEGEAVLQQMIELASPLPGFLRECCILDPTAVTLKDDIYEAWELYQSSKDIQTKSEAIFARDLLAAGQGRIKSTRPWNHGHRTQCFQGIRLRDFLDDADDAAAAGKSEEFLLNLEKLEKQES